MIIIILLEPNLCCLYGSRCFSLLISFLRAFAGKRFFDGFKQTSREYGYLFCMPTDALRSHTIAGVFFYVRHENWVDKEWQRVRVAMEEQSKTYNKILFICLMAQFAI